MVLEIATFEEPVEHILDLESLDSSE